MRLVVARCSVDYAGRLSAHLPLATRLLVLKADGSVLVHADSLSYKPLNWMSPPCTLAVMEPDADQAEAGVVEIWRVAQAKTADLLVISIHEILHDTSHELGIDPGLQKDGVEADLQKLLAEQIERLGEGHTLVRREYMTAIGPVDILARDALAAGQGRRQCARALGLPQLQTVELDEPALHAHGDGPGSGAGGRGSHPDLARRAGQDRRSPRDQHPRDPARQCP